MIGFLLFACTAFAAHRPSLLDLSQKLSEGPAITQAYKDKKSSDYNKLIKSNEKLMSDFSGLVKASAAFARGEIEQEKVMNFLTQLLQLSIIKMRQAAASGQTAVVMSEMDTWFAFLADLSYEETTLISLRLVHVLRSLLMDEIEILVRQKPMTFHLQSAKFRSLRAPWPVDRVLIFESRRMLKGANLQKAEKVAAEIQKNPYQTTESLLQKMQSVGEKELQFLKELWREKDLEMMKSEVNRLNLLYGAALWIDYMAKNQKAPQSWSDLKIAAPTDYNSGKPMDWHHLTRLFANSP